MNRKFDMVMLDPAAIKHRYTRETNPNKMAPERFEILRLAIRQEGFLQPILVTHEHEIVDGHHRTEAAMLEELDLIPCVVLRPDADEFTKKALSLGLNRIRGDLSLSQSADILAELAGAWGYDEISALTGFTDNEIEALLNTSTPFDDESVLDDASGAGTEDAVPDKPFVLEVSFATKEQYQLVRKKLKKAAGKGNDLSVGLLNVLGEA